MPFDWESGKPVDVGGFDWDAGEPIAPPKTLAPPAIKPYRVPMAETNDGWIVRGMEKAAGAIPDLMATPAMGRVKKTVDRFVNESDKPLIPEIQIDKAGPDAGPIEQGLRGAGRSLVNNARAMSTPTNVGIMGGLAAANVAQAFFPPIAPIVQSLNATAAVKFGADMLGALPEQNAAYQDAVKRGDVEGAAQALTDVGVTATMAAGLARGAIEQARPAVESKMGAEPASVAKTETPAAPSTEKWTDLTEPRDVKPGEAPVELTGPVKPLAKVEPSLPEFAIDTPKVEIAPLPPEAGAIRVPQLSRPKPPLAPEEAHFTKMLTEREALRSTGIKRGVEAFHAGVAKLKSEVVDSLSPILDAVDRSQRKHDYELRPAHRFEYWADRALGAREMSERFMRDNGLLDIIKTPENRKEFDYFDQFLIAKEVIKEQQRGNRETGRDVVVDQQAVSAFENRVIDKKTGMTYGDLAEKFYQYNDKLLDYSVAQGLIPKETAANWREIYGREHVPLKRVFDAIESATQEHPIQGAQVASLGKQTVYHERKGSDRPIDNPIYELMQRTRRAVAEGERNNAARVLASYSELPGMRELIWEVTDSGPAPKNHISFLDNGKRRYFGTTPEIEAAAKSLDARNLGVIAQMVAYPARMFRFFTTGVNLAFAAANVPVDISTTAITSKNALQTTWNPQVWGKAFLAAVKHDDLWSKIESHGAGFTQLDLYRNTREHTIDAIRAEKNAKERGKYIMGHPIRSGVELFRALEDVVSRSEQFGRARLFEGTRRATERQGHTPENAEILGAIASNNELPNYRRVGTVMAALRGVFVYTSAAIQGSRNVVRSVKERPVETLAKIATTIALPTFLATLYNTTDPEAKNIYDDIREYEKENNFIVVLPGAKLNPKTNKYEGVIKVKMEPGVGRLATPLRRMVEAWYGADPQSALEVAQSLLGSVLPFEPTGKGIASFAMPQVGKAPFQAVANYDFFRDGPKVPRRLQDLPVEQQVLPNTSGTMEKVAGTLGVSPIKTEEFFKDMIGGSSDALLNTIDTAAAWAGVIPQEKIGGRSVGSTIASRFAEARGGEQSQREYDAIDKIRDKAVNQAIAVISKHPAYQQITDEKQRLEINRKVAASVMAQFNGATVSNKAWGTISPSDRMRVLRNLDAMVGGKPVLRKSVPFIR